MNLSDLGELELIKKINKKIKLFSQDVVKGIGDDCAVVNFDKKYYLLLTTDSLLEEVHFSLKHFKPELIGSKSMEINVSDIASMGGLPKYALVSLVAPKNTSINFVDKLFDGITNSAKKYKINIIGGNLSDGKSISISITMVGFVEKKYLCLRSEAKVNDLIAVTGPLGASKAGLDLLKANKKGKSIKSYLEPKSQFNIGRKLSKYVNAMEDISDGLAAEISNICNESKTGAVIYKEKIPIKKSTILDAKKLNKNALDFALYWGEDFELVFTINKNKLKLLKRIKYHIVGKILAKKKGIYLLDKNKRIRLKKGYQHFKK